MFVIGFLNITRKSRNFHAFTQAYLAHAQINFPAVPAPSALSQLISISLFLEGEGGLELAEQ